MHRNKDMTYFASLWFSAQTAQELMTELAVWFRLKKKHISFSWKAWGNFAQKYYHARLDAEYVWPKGNATYLWGVKRNSDLWELVTTIWVKVNLWNSDK